MKYMWIIILIILDIIWLIFSIKDIIFTYKLAHRHKVIFSFIDLEDYTIGFIVVHLGLLFVYSLSLYIKGME